jgi:hypothetical protein
LGKRCIDLAHGPDQAATGQWHLRAKGPNGLGAVPRLLAALPELETFPGQSTFVGFGEVVDASSGLIRLGSAPASRMSASLVVSSMRVLLLWSRRTALNASWHNTKRFFVCSASKTISERIADTFRGTGRVVGCCNILAKNRCRSRKTFRLETTEPRPSEFLHGLLHSIIPALAVPSLPTMGAITIRRRQRRECRRTTG